MIVMVRTDDPAFKPYAYSHIECDVEGCGERSPGFTPGTPNLLEQGWFIEGGRHRCPKHFDDDVPSRGVDRREE
jgi:hypothetical protein